MEFWGRGIRARMKEIKDALSTVKIKVSTICSGYRGDLLSPVPARALYWLNWLDESTFWFFVVETDAIVVRALLGEGGLGR